MFQKWEEIPSFYYKIHNTIPKPTAQSYQIVFLWGEMLTPISLKRLDCHLTAFDGQIFFVRDGRQHSSFAHLSTLSTALQSFTHLSFHWFLTDVHPSVMTYSDPRLLHRHLKEMSLMLAILLKENFFFSLVKPSSFPAARQPSFKVQLIVVILNRKSQKHKAEMMRR